MTTRHEFVPSKRRYFWLSCVSYLVVALVLSGILYFLHLYFALDSTLIFSLLAYTPIHVLLTWIETRWVEKDLSISITSDQITGPNGKGFRWIGQRWDRISIPLQGIDRAKSAVGLKKVSRFFMAKSVFSFDGYRLFITEAFTKDQTESILQQIDV